LLDLIGHRPQDDDQWAGQQERVVPIVPPARRKRLKIAAPITARKLERDVDRLPKEWRQDLYDEPAAIQDNEEDEVVIALINSEPNADKRQALRVAYNWALARAMAGKVATKADFLNRAKNERKCEYLKEHREEIWEELEALIS
jgi:hypothetical protein